MYVSSLTMCMCLCDALRCDALPTHSGGGDNVVNLWRIASCSSAPWLGADMGCIEDEADLEGLEQLDISRTTDADPPDIKVCFAMLCFAVPWCVVWYAGMVWYGMVWYGMV